MESSSKNDSTIITIEPEPLPLLRDWIDNMKQWPTSELTHQVRRMSLDDKLKSVKSPIQHRRRSLVTSNKTMRILCEEKLKVKTAMSGDPPTDEEMRQQQEQAEQTAQKFLDIANEVKRRKLMKRSSSTAFNVVQQSTEGNLNLEILYEHSGVILKCLNYQALDQSEFQEARNNLINATLGAFFPTNEANIVQDFSTVANVSIVLLPSQDHRNAILHLNTSMDDDTRTTSSGKVITFVQFTKEEMKKTITIGSNFTFEPTMQPITAATINSLDARLTPNLWMKMQFGSWSMSDMNFATYYSEDPQQADFIRACNNKLYERHSRHERGSETITISSAYEKFLSLIIHPHDEAVVRFEHDLNKKYTETRSGIVKMGNRNNYNTEEAMINVFMVLPRRRLNRNRLN